MFVCMCVIMEEIGRNEGRISIGWWSAWDLEASGLMHIMVTFDMQIANDCVDHNTNHGNGPFSPTEMYECFVLYALCICVMRMYNTVSLLC